MVCPKCGSDNVSVQLVQTGSRSSYNGRGCLWEMGRLMLIFCTCGLWLLVGKSKGRGRTKVKNKKTCVCQSCGNSWRI